MDRNELLRSLFQANQQSLAEHTRRMEQGCLVCRSARPGRVCPDCYTCIACGPGCDECAQYRGHKSK